MAGGTICFCSASVHALEASALAIVPHRWPLPSHEESAKVMVFELDVPIAFAAWRDATKRVLVDILEVSGFLPAVTHQSYNTSGLGKYFQPKSQDNYLLFNPPQRIRPVHVMAVVQEEDFLYGSGGSAVFIDNKNGWYMSAYPGFSSLSIIGDDGKDRCLGRFATKCTFQLSGPSRALQYALDSTSHTSNGSIAYQSACPAGWSRHEYYAFTTLRAGSRLQWLNMLREIKAGNLNLNRLETCLLFQQAMWQAGPLGSSKTNLRESHEILRDEVLCRLILGALEKSLESVGGSWLLHVSMQIFISLAARILTITQSGQIKSRAAQFLKTCRAVCMDWMLDIFRHNHSSSDDAGRQRWQNLALVVAATCRQTFDVDPDVLFAVFNDERALADFIECAMCIYNNSNTRTSRSDSEALNLQNLLTRDSGLAHKMEPYLRDLVSTDNEWFHGAISRVIPQYVAGDGWRTLRAPNGRWVGTRTGGPVPKTVQYNLLQGSMLIDGMPLGNLPQIYMDDPLFIRLFQNRTFVVVRADMPGMSFQTVYPVCETDSEIKIYFGMRNKELIIRTKRGSTVHEIIRPDRLTGDFPESMLHSRVHFLDLDRKVLELRPLRSHESLWVSSPKNWMLYMNSSQVEDAWLPKGRCTLGSTEDECTLIDYHSNMQHTIASIFEPIERSSHIEVMVCRNNRVVVRLARYGLEFGFDGTNVEKSDINSHNFPGMIVDARPHVGQDMHTFYGLQNYLVLREAESALYSSVRTVIIPHGEIRYAASAHGTSVRIETGNAQKMEYHVYTIDNLIGRLISNGSIRARLYKIYLHALTSYCLPDPLTGVTGAEQALDDLRSAGSFSFRKLDAGESQGPSELRLLHQIASLTPVRKYHPQTTGLHFVNWDEGLPSFCQHGEFYTTTESILEHWHMMAAIQGMESNLQLARDSVRHLEDRAAIRHAAHLPFEYGGMLHSRAEDTQYHARIFSEQPLERTVYHVSKLTNEWTTNLQPTLESLASLQESNNLFRAARSLAGSRHESLTSNWYFVYAFCRNCTEQRGKYKLLFFLTTLAYSAISMELIETMLAFATNPVFSSIAPPMSHEILQPTDEGTIESKLKMSQFGMAVHHALREMHSRYHISHPKPLIEAYHPNEYYRALTVRNIVHNFRDFLKTHTTPVVLDSSPTEEQIARAASTQARSSGCPSAVAGAMGGTTDLTKSMEALFTHESDCLLDNEAHVPSPDASAELSHLKQCLEYMYNIFSAIVAVLGPEVATVQEMCYISGLQPKVTVKSLLSQLRTSNGKELPLEQGWKQILVCFARSVSLYQQATRMYHYARGQDLVEFRREQTNTGYKDWNPSEYPDWLLFEIDHNIRIRPLQARIAKRILQGCFDGATMQLNMGEGKSSVIIPTIAATLADGGKLVRVLVPKQLSNQMFHLLAQKLSGLLNRRIYYFSFSRQSKHTLTPAMAPKIRRLYTECMSNRGIFLSQPEHVLSFKLTGIEMLLNNDSLAQDFLELQRWLEKNVRDIFDESDELLHVKYELTYTLGMEQPLDLGSRRWMTIQKLFGSVREYMRELKHQHPRGIELIERHNAPESFPFVRLLNNDAEMDLMKRIAENIVEKNFTEWVPVGCLTKKMKIMLLRYINTKEVGDEKVSMLKGNLSLLLLLKGLIAHGILGYVLREKRWRLDYGLRNGPGNEVHKSNLAVPYRGKDSPVPQAVFGHPDITIALTCLCYYYQGLSEHELQLCFESLYRLSDPDGEYASWINPCKQELPPPLRHLKGLNIQDTYQWSCTIYPLLKLNKGAIDFYLSGRVFPRECKEFPYKLSASSWDLAETKQYPVTGFSGTNDSQYLLPTSIKQVDLQLVNQVQSTAEMLTRILRPESNFYKCAQTATGERLGTRAFLQTLVDMYEKYPIQVLLDVGAQVLDIENKEVGLIWLTLGQELNHPWTAVLFFDQNDELMVITRDGSEQSYISSPYVRNMQNCLVYLDEAHTRGTDLRLPKNCRAAVTLGPKLTKDKLVQSCMRMRKLGHGQSVYFFAPPEVDHKIMEHSKSERNEDIHTVDILSWVMHETCMQIQQSVTTWANQGIRHQVRKNAWSNYPGKSNCTSLTSTWRTSGAKTLMQLYSSSSTANQSVTSIIDQRLQDHDLGARHKCLKAIKRQCREFQVTSLEGGALEEVQEREIILEEEREEQREQLRAPLMQPYRHSLAHSLTHFVRTGQPPPALGQAGSPFLTIMNTLSSTSFSHLTDQLPWSNNILVTIDFHYTVSINHTSRSDCPFEANELLPYIQHSKFATLHMYSARAQELAPDFDDLTYAAIPTMEAHQLQEWIPYRDALMTQVNVYAGALFFRSMEMYLGTCQFLGMHPRTKRAMVPGPTGTGATDATKAWPVEEEGILVGNENTMADIPRSPFGLVRRLVEARRKGVLLGKTHMGHLLQWRKLKEPVGGDEPSEEGRLGKRKREM